MPVVDEFSRAQPLSISDHSASEVIEAARRTRTRTMSRWLADLWRKLTKPSVTTAVDWTAWRGE
jgi:hypothetical protein